MKKSTLNEKDNNATMNTNTTNQEAFTSLLRTYEEETRKGTNTEAYTKALTELATAVSYSVLKKCINVSYSETLVKVKNAITHDTKTLSNTKHSSNEATETVYTKDGDRETVTKDSSYKQAFDKLASECLLDGLDIVNTAIVSIIEETRKTDGETVHFMENAYNVKRLKRKVWIKMEDSASGWEEVATSPIKEVYRAIRRYIENNRTLGTDARNGYAYLEDIATEEETGTEEVIYRRLRKYSQLATYTEDFNGQQTLSSVNPCDAATVEELIAVLNLSKQQVEILQYRMSGYGYKAIATKLGVKGANVQTQLKRIQTKAETSGIVSKQALAHIKSVEKSKKYYESEKKSTRLPHIETESERIARLEAKWNA